MMDAFEGIRERLDRAEETEAAFPHEDLDKFVSPGAQQATEDVARLLSAVDALMEVARALDAGHVSDIVEAMDMLTDYSEGGYDPNVYAALVAYKEALDVLPPELKEALK